VAGTDVAGPAVFYFNLGASAPVWKDATSADFTTPPTLGTDVDFVALAFSPNFASDMVLTAVSESESEKVIKFHIISFNHKAWNSDAGFPETYPVTLESADTLTCQAAEISLDPEYLGGDDSTRIAMVGLAITKVVDSVTDAGGIYRLKDATVKELKENQGIKSIAWDGTDLVAGSKTRA